MDNRSGNAEQKKIAYETAKEFVLFMANIDGDKDVEIAKQIFSTIKFEKLVFIQFSSYQLNNPLRRLRGMLPNEQLAHQKAAEKTEKRCCRNSLFLLNFV